MTWTAEIIAQLRDLHQEGCSAAQIASRLGVSRNAVIGKLHRIGLSKGRPKNSNAKRPRGHRKTPPNWASPEPLKKEEDTSPVTISDLKYHHCRFPLWDWETTEATRLYCGKARMVGSAYCDEHTKECTQ